MPAIKTGFRAAGFDIAPAAQLSACLWNGNVICRRFFGMLGYSAPPEMRPNRPLSSGDAKRQPIYLKEEREYG
jgi:hypothetical protein